MLSFLFGVISIIFVFGAWSISNKYENNLVKRSTCYIGFGVSVLSIVVSVFQVIGNIGTIQYMDKMEQSSRMQYGEYYDMALQMSVAGAEWHGLWGKIFLLAIVFIVWTAISFFASRRYWKAIKKVSTENIGQ